MLSARYSCQIWIKLDISRRNEVSHFMAIRLVGAELLHADRQTDVET